jgi:hypothetical protein
VTNRADYRAARKAKEAEEQVKAAESAAAANTLLGCLGVKTAPAPMVGKARTHRLLDDEFVPGKKETVMQKPKDLERRDKVAAILNSTVVMLTADEVWDKAKEYARSDIQNDLRVLVKDGRISREGHARSTRYGASIGTALAASARPEEKSKADVHLSKDQAHLQSILKGPAGVTATSRFDFAIDQRGVVGISEKADTGMPVLKMEPHDLEIFIEFLTNTQKLWKDRAPEAAC